MVPLVPFVDLDHNASTPLHPAVLEACARALRDHGANPASVHSAGSAARAALEQAREQVAALIGARGDEIVFTSGATESNVLALTGVLAPAAGRRAAASAVEHPSVLEPLAGLARAGLERVVVPVSASGRVEPQAVADSLGEELALFTLQLANHETGVVQPVAAIAAAVRERAAAIHTDASQALGRLAVDVHDLGVDLLSGSGHKMNAPPGIGFLYVRRGLALAPLLRGGGQERGRRAGMPNLVGAIGLGVACEIQRREGAARAEAWRTLRDRLWDGLRAKVPGVARTSAEVETLANVLHVHVEGASGEALLAALDLEGVAVSTGAACSSGSTEPSPVLLAMGETPERARQAIRLSVGQGVDAAQIDHVLALLPDLVARVRAAERA